VEKWIERQLLERQPLLGQHAVMYQCWRHLLFLHWAVEPEIVQRTLPQGLSVDTYEKKAWIGIVPFFMRRVRPNMLPFLSSNFLELNLRTYVKDHNGIPGVWFYSLDANHPPAVWMARLFFGLPYRHAKMHADTTHTEISYSCQRRGSSMIQKYRFLPADDLGEAKMGSLEFFLIERYRLFSFRGNHLLTGRVYHSPYHLRKAIVPKFDKRLFQLDSLPIPPGPPDSALYSSRVDVTIYPAGAAR
jgi:uncharacterized protein